MNLRIAGLVRSFGRTRVLRKVDASFESGTIHKIVGPNGSGKTTLLRVLAGILGFERGHFAVGDTTVSAEGELPWLLRQRIGYIGHDSFAYPQLTSRENLKLFSVLYDTPDERVEEALERYGLTSAAKRPVGGYSRGMIQRVALSRLWVQNPDILLLDEPGTGLDLHTHTMVMEDLRQAAEQSKTVLIVSHDPRDLEALPGSLHQMERGQLTMTADES